MMVLDANILIRAVLGIRVRTLLQRMREAADSSLQSLCSPKLGNILWRSSSAKAAGRAHDGDV